MGWGMRRRRVHFNACLCQEIVRFGGQIGSGHGQGRVQEYVFLKRNQLKFDMRNRPKFKSAYSHASRAFDQFLQCKR